MIRRPMPLATLLLVALSLLADAWAQPPTTEGVAGEILKSITPPPARPTAPLVIDDRTTPPRAVADIEGLRIEIKGFRFTNLTLVPESEMQAAVAPFIGPDRKFQDLLDAAAAAKKVLVRHGYFLADVIVPEQKISDGVIELLVLEGRLGKINIEIADDVAIDEETIRGIASALEEGSIIQTDTLERALFLISDLKGISLRSIIEPGEKLGTANLTLKITAARRLEGNVDLDANGSLYNGVYRLGAGIDINSPTGRGDMINLRTTTSDFGFDNHGGLLKYTRASYLTPVGYWGTKVGASLSSLEYRLGTDTFIPLKASGWAWVQSAMGVHPFIRSRNTNLLGLVQWDARKFHDAKISGTAEKETTVVSATLNGDFRDTLLGGGINIYSLSSTRGELEFLTANEKTADAGNARTQGIYKKTNFTYSRLQSLGNRSALYFSWSQQWADKNLDPSEKFSLGGVSAVRAYPQGEGSGDEGSVATLEARYRLPTGEKIAGNAALVVFYDAGWSTIYKSPDPWLDPTAVRNRKIAGYGIGLNWDVHRDWFMRASMAWRDNAPSQSEHVDRIPRIYFQLSKYF